ncbi:MAG: hypothetical protein BZ136_07620 [Methanosphaera sp. rholeuAM74]|nr:MAG: hypothetical protein BZ136_07620 [Methanosphaera sp. rholeuAM74]
MDEITFTPIGYIKSPYTSIEDMPKNTSQSGDTQAQIIVDEKYIECMSDMMVNDEYMLIFYFHKSIGYEDKVPLRGVGPVMGVFSTHAPNRPNPIGVSTIKIREIDSNVITFTGVDMLDATPVLDLKKIY